jgi:DNA protecting protein DprA
MLANRGSQAEDLKRENKRVSKQYHLDAPVARVELQTLIREAGRGILDNKQFDMLRAHGTRDAFVFCAGDQTLLQRPVVSVVGTREVTEEGERRARRLARELAAAGVVVMSGLARGVDTAAHKGAIDASGSTIAVIGTPLQKASPIENADLQIEIATKHLLVSPFPENSPIFKGNFPKRNRVMALLSDATVIVEASDTSGTLHQAAECLRQGRWLFILKSVIEDPSLSWPSRFLGEPRTVVVTKTEDILSRLLNLR